MLRAGASISTRLAAVMAYNAKVVMPDAHLATSPASSTAGSSASPPLMYAPYETEGGRVPVYSMLHGRIQRRNWMLRNPQWCDLCNEPIGHWLNHMSRKDHALQDMHYTQLAEWPRRWNPQELLCAFRDHLRVDGIDSFHAVFSKDDQQQRNEIFSMLMRLEEAGMLYFGEARDTYLHMMVGGLRGMDHQGALVLHECLFAPFMYLYPEAHIQDYSNLTDFITCSYNMETVYDLCGLYKLDRVALKAQYGPSSPAAMGLGGIATSSSARSGYQNEELLCDSSSSASDAAEVDAANAAAAGGATLSARQVQMLAAKQARDKQALEEETFSRKAVFVRQVLGQLRWLLMPAQEHPAGYTFPEHIMTLGELCLKSLVVQIIAARVCEYTVRAEPTWHRFGFERKKQHLNVVAKQAEDVVPRLFRSTYRPMSPDLDDLYSNRSTVLNSYVEKALARKGLPVPAGFAGMATFKAGRHSQVLRAETPAAEPEMPTSSASATATADAVTEETPRNLNTRALFSKAKTLKRPTPFSEPLSVS